MLDTDHLHRITAELSSLAVDGVDGLDPEALCAVALTARRLRELADHVEVHALGALEPTGYTESTAGYTVAGWFSRETKLPSAVGAAQVRAARALRHLPETDAAWLDGRLTREHVKVLADAANPRIREHIVTLEPELIGIAEEYTFLHWRRRVGDVVTRLDTEGPDPDDPNHTSASWGRTGLFARLRASFAGADVEALEQIIEARTDRLFRENTVEHNQSADLPLLSRSQLRARAIVDLILHGPEAAETAALDTDDGGTDEPDTTSPPKKKRSSGSGIRVGVMLVLHADRVRADLPNLHPGQPAQPGVPQLNRDVTWSLTNPDGQHLAIEPFASLLCDSEASALLVDDDDNPLVLGRSSRLASFRQRRVIIERDGGCAFPGCECPVARLEIHHVQRYIDGGLTDVHIMVGLCRRHHGVTHRRGWALRASGDGWFFWITPSGDSFWSQRHGKQRAGPTPYQLDHAA